MVAACQRLQPGRDTKAELNRRSQVCEALAGTGVRVAENGLPAAARRAKVGQASVYRALYSSLEVLAHGRQRVSPNTHARKERLAWKAVSI